jgi:cytochrome c oxidase assembly factor CtaG
MVSFWLIFPLFFSPHGIYSQGQKAWKSLLTSIRLTNLTFVKTSLFIMIALLVNQGLNIVWQIPPEESWLMMISIIGHAFVTTGMLAASFLYYQDMIRWVEELQVLSPSAAIVEERSTSEK